MRRRAAARGAGVERLEAEGLRGRVGAEREVAVLGILEARVGHDRTRVLPLRLPRGQILVAGKHDRLARVPVAVGLRAQPGRPVAMHERRVGRPPDDVPLEAKTRVLLDFAPLDLPIAAHREHVVLHGIVAAVVLVEAAGRRPIHEVLPHHDLARTLVGVEAPAAVLMARDVVDDVALHDRAGGDAERVDASHVG